MNHFFGKSPLSLAKLREGEVAVKKTVLWGVFWIVVGVAITAVSLYMTETMGTTASELYKTTVRLVNTLGIAWIAFGFFNVILQIKDWREYFEDRIKRVLFEHAYLKHFDKTTLKEIQINALKAYFDDPEVDREGGFLNYFYENLYRYISEPYREEVRSEIFLERERDDRLVIYDKVTYACRKTEMGLQPSVKWRPDPEEFSQVDEVSIKIQFPATHQRSGEVKTLREGKLEDPAKTVEVSLEEFEDVDGLIVIVESRYEIASERFQYWQMAHPTKNFSFTLQWPKGYRIQYKPLVINPDLCLTTHRDCYLNIKYDAWMLPMSGLAWRFLKSSHPNCRQHAGARDGESADAPSPPVT